MLHAGVDNSSKLGVNLVDYIEWDPKEYNTYSHFNITEDLGVHDHSCGASEPLASFWLFLYSPLPTDLPPVNKDNLILSAAYTGDEDHYARFRRPQMIEQEFHAIILGIYHHPLGRDGRAHRCRRFPKAERRCPYGAQSMFDASSVTILLVSQLIPQNRWFLAESGGLVLLLR